MRARYKKEVVGVQASANQALDSFQQKLSEISIKAARVFVEADKKTNAFNISIAVINFISSIFLLVFTRIFDQPVSSTATFD